MRTIYSLAIGLVAVAFLLALGACSEKPPGCADAEAVSTAKELIIGEARRRVSEKGIASSGDPDGVMSKYLDRATVEVTNIVDDGYNSTKHLQSCKAHFKVMPPDADGLEGDASYTTRRVLDAPGKFMLELEGVDQFALVLDVAAHSYRDANAYLGTYAGTYECTGVGGAQDGPGGPFSQQVMMNVVPDPGSAHPKATLERVSRGGGAESLAGGASSDFELVGKGANTPEDRWTTRFSVKISGGTVTGNGDIRAPDMAIVRRCTLNLVKGAQPTEVPPTPVQSAGKTSTPPGMSFPGEYEGTGDSTVTATIGEAATDGGFPVSLETSAVGGCGGELKGTAKRAADSTVSMSVERGGARCGIALTMTPDGQLETHDSKGCATFHGEACSFGGVALKRTK